MPDMTWRELVAQAMAVAHDDGPIVASTLTADEWDREFDDGYGLPEGAPFTAWTATRVYFPVKYDGAEWAGSAPRNPSSEPTQHQGGG